MALSPILDASGRPIVKADLKKEQGGVTTRGVRQPFGRHQAPGLTPGKLARILRQSIDGDAEAYLELAEDIEERDLHYAGVLSIRKRQVAGLQIDVEAAGVDRESVRDAELLREVISRDSFEDELIDILDAIGKSYSATEIIWDTSEGQWMPEALKWRDPRWFTFDVNDGDTLQLRGEAGMPEALSPFKWIVHRAKVKSGLTIRGGLARSIAWTFLFKSFTGKDWAIFAEAYGQPLRVGKFGPDASPTDKDVLLNAVASIGTDFAAIIPQSMSIEFVQASISGSHELYEKRQDWLDRQVSKIVLGQTATTDAQAGGFAVGKVHDGVRADIERSDAKQLAATLNRDLVRPLIDLNHGRRKSYPKIKIGRPDEVDIEKLVKNVSTLVPLGLKVGMATMRDKIGVPDPERDEELLVAPRKERSVDNDLSPGKDEPRAKRLQLVTQSALLENRPEHDAVDRAVHEIVEDGWEAMMTPVVAGLEDELATATSEAAAQAIIARRIETMGVTKLAEVLARASFAARLAGEVGDDL
jgi:phage gp29-like protein